MGRNHQVIDISGVAHLDYFDLYRKFTYTSQESYRLDHIAFVSDGEKKMIIRMKHLKIGIQKIFNHS